MTGRVLIVDDHRLLAVSLQLALWSRSWEVEVATEIKAESILATAGEFRPECVLLDLHLGESTLSGLDLIRPLMALGAGVVLLTAETDWHLLACALEAGALGWISKSAFVDEVVTAVGDALAGRPLIGRTTREQLLEDLRIWRDDLALAMSPFERLTQRERDVFAAMIDGLSPEEIATTQVVALTTVRSQIRSILLKLGVHSQLAAVAAASRAGWRRDISSIVRMPAGG